MTDDRVQRWLDNLERRYLADLMPAEIARALRALSSCYVERRAKLASGAALASRGKRAAFALFYGPVHFLTVREIVRALSPRMAVARIVELGCGTGAAGAAWALETRARIDGIDRSSWAVEEANRTYRDLGVAGRASRRDIGVKSRFRDFGSVAAAQIRRTESEGATTGILAAYVVNELDPDIRAELLHRLIAAPRSSTRVLIVEPVSRRVAPWWDEWQQGFERAGGEAHEWRFPANLAARQQALARAAGLQPQELTARSLLL